MSVLPEKSHSSGLRPVLVMKGVREFASNWSGEWAFEVFCNGPRVRMVRARELEGAEVRGGPGCEMARVDIPPGSRF